VTLVSAPASVSCAQSDLGGVGEQLHLDRFVRGSLPGPGPQPGGGGAQMFIEEQHGTERVNMLATGWEIVEILADSVGVSAEKVAEAAE
jgi:hypothetical protein